eukprot:gene15115-17875_t
MYYAFDSAMESTVYDIGGAHQHGRTRGSAWVPVFTSGHSGRALYLNASTSDIDIYEGVYVDAYSTSASSKFEATGAVYWSIALAKGSYGAVDIGEDALDALFTASTAGIVKRLCSSCATSHREIYYKRLPRRAPISLHGYLASNWSSTANILNVDFELYSTHADALAGANRWTYCNYYSAQGVGFPGECGEAGAVTGQWNTWAPAAGGSAGHDDVAFYVQIDCPCAISTCACKTCTSIRFGDVDPACMEYTQSYCATYSGSDAGCSNFTGRVQRTMNVGTAGGVLNTDTPELLRGRKVVVTIPPNAVSTTTSLTIRELRADEVAAASQHLVTSRWYRAVLSDYISLVPHGSTFAGAMLGSDYLHLTVDFYFSLELLGHPDGEALLNFAAATVLDRDGLCVWLDSSSALWLRRSDEFGVESGDDLLLSASVSYGSWHHIVISMAAPCAEIGTVVEVWLDGRQCVVATLPEAARVTLVNHTDAVFDSANNIYWAIFEPPLVTEAEVVPLPVSPPPPSPPPCPPSPPAPSPPPGGIVLVDAVMAFPGVNLTALLANSTLAAALEAHLVAVFSRAAGVPSSQVSISFNTTAPEGITVTDTGDDETQAAHHNVTWYAIALVTFDWDDLDKAEAFEELLEGSDEHIDGNASAAANATDAAAHNRSSADDLSSAADTSSTSPVFTDDAFWATLALDPPEVLVFDATFTSNFQTAMAASSGISTDDIAIISKYQGSVSINSQVLFSWDDISTATSFQTTLTSSVATIFVTSAPAGHADSNASAAPSGHVGVQAASDDATAATTVTSWFVSMESRVRVDGGTAVAAEEAGVLLAEASASGALLREVRARVTGADEVHNMSLVEWRVTGTAREDVLVAAGSAATSDVVALTEPGRVYYNVKETPSVQHIILGVTPAAAVASMVNVPVAFEAVAVEVAGLNSESEYTIHLLAEDSATPPNWQAEPSQLQATTLDITPPAIQLNGASSLRVTPNNMLQPNLTVEVEYCTGHG